MEWLDALFGGDSNDNAPARRRGQGGMSGERDPFGRILPEPMFEAFRNAWKAGLGLFDLFGKDPVRLKEPVGSKAANRRPDVAKVGTFLDRTGQLDLITTDGPTGYYGSRVDQGIRRFQKDNALKIDGLINPNGPTIQRLGALLLPPSNASARAAAPGSSQSGGKRPTATIAGEPSSASFLTRKVADWRSRRTPDVSSPPLSDSAGKAAQATKTPAQTMETGGAKSELVELPHLTPVLEDIKANYHEKVETFRRMNMPTAADNLEHFLAGSGEPRRLPREEMIKLKPLRDAEERNIERFSQETFRGRTKSNPDVRKLATLQDGHSYKFSDNWDRDLELRNFLWNATFGDRDFAAALGRATLTSEGEFNAMRTGNEIVITGMVTHSVSDRYDFHRWQPGAEGALALQNIVELDRSGSKERGDNLSGLWCRFKMAS